MTTPLDMYRAKLAARDPIIYGEPPTLTDAQVLVAIAREIQNGTLTVRELRELIGDPPSDRVALLGDAAMNIEHWAHKALFVCRTREDFVRGVLPLAKERYPLLGGVYNAANQTWSFPSGARIWFGVVRDVGDARQFTGYAFNWIGFDDHDAHTKDELALIKTRARLHDGLEAVIRK